MRAAKLHKTMTDSAVLDELGKVKALTIARGNRVLLEVSKKQRALLASLKAPISPSYHNPVSLGKRCFGGLSAGIDARPAPRRLVAPRIPGGRVALRKSCHLGTGSIDHGATYISLQPPHGRSSMRYGL